MLFCHKLLNSKYPRERSAKIATETAMDFLFSFLSAPRSFSAKKTKKQSETIKIIIIINFITHVCD